MFDFLEARIATMLRTSRSLLRMSRRHLMKDLRMEEKLRKEVMPNLQNAASRGDVDEVLRSFKHGEGDLDKMFADLDKVERNTYLAEYSSLDKLVDMERGFEKVMDQLLKLQHRFPKEKFPSQWGVLEKLKIAFQKMRAELHRDSELEVAELRKQFQAIEREAQGETLQLQTFVFALSTVMSAMDELWRLRGEIRRENRTGNDLLKGERTVLSLLNDLANTNDVKKQTLLLNQLQKQEHVLEEDLLRFNKLFKQTEFAFTLVMKVCSDIYFQFVKDQKTFDQFLDNLRKARFPEHDLEELVRVQAAAKAENKHELEVLMNVVRRGSRLQQGKLSI